MEICAAGRATRGHTARAARPLPGRGIRPAGRDGYAPDDRQLVSGGLHPENCRSAAFQRAPEELRSLVKSRRAPRVLRRADRDHPLHAHCRCLHGYPSAAAAARRYGVSGRRRYACIIRNRLYGARVRFRLAARKSYAMLKPRRIPHVRGCDRRQILAERWGRPGAGGGAAILPRLHEKGAAFGAACAVRAVRHRADALERRSEKLLHAETAPPSRSGNSARRSRSSPPSAGTHRAGGDVPAGEDPLYGGLHRTDPQFSRFGASARPRL